MRKTDMYVVGEMTIALDKVAQGIYSSKINSNTTEFYGSNIKKYY